MTSKIPYPLKAGRVFLMSSVHSLACQQRDTLYKVGLREHIKGLRVHQPVAVVGAERGDVACQRAGITRNINDGTRSKRLQRLDRLGVTSGARWVNQCQVNTLAPVVELPK